MDKEALRESIFREIEKLQDGEKCDLDKIIELCQKEQLEKVVLWALNQGFSTSHADTIEALLEEISLDITELRKLGFAGISKAQT